MGSTCQGARGVWYDPSVTFVPDRPSTRVPRTEPLKRLLAERKIALKKRWGQHFYLDQNLLEFTARTADVKREDVVLEIGCGLGHLTRTLSPLAARVVGVEIDHGLATLLAERTADLENLDLVEGDVLGEGEALSPEVGKAVRRALAAAPGDLLVVANLPYSVSATVILALLESDLSIAQMVVMIQKEVAERLASGAGDSAYGITSVLVQAKADVHVRRRVPPEVFWPRPKVPSSIVVITPKPEGRALRGEAYEKLKAVTKRVFLHRRKTLGASIRHLEGSESLAERLQASGLDPGLRVDELGLKELLALAGIPR